MKVFLSGLGQRFQLQIEAARFVASPPMQVISCARVRFLRMLSTTPAMRPALEVTKRAPHGLQARAGDALVHVDANARSARSGTSMIPTLRVLHRSRKSSSFLRPSESPSLFPRRKPYRPPLAP